MEKSQYCYYLGEKLPFSSEETSFSLEKIKRKIEKIEKVKKNTHHKRSWYKEETGEDLELIIEDFESSALNLLLNLMREFLGEKEVSSSSMENIRDIDNKRRTLMYYYEKMKKIKREEERQCWISPLDKTENWKFEIVDFEENIDFKKNDFINIGKFFFPR